MQNITEGAERIKNIIVGLRTFSRMDGDSMSLSDIHENIDATLIILQHEIKNKVKVIKSYGDIPKIICYTGKLNQVFLNIILNAAQSINKYGAVEITTEIFEDINEICISVKDTGKGIAPDIIDKIFEPFFTTKEEGEGTGLGLYISYDIIKKHKGRIEINSLKNNGTEFKIFIPSNLNVLL